MTNRAERRKFANTLKYPRSDLFSDAFFGLVDLVAPRVGISRARIEEMGRGDHGSAEEYEALAKCFILMTGMVLTERETK